MNRLFFIGIVSCGLGAGCFASTGNYVAQIRSTEGGIEVTTCPFDEHGKATTFSNCTTEIITVLAENVGTLPDESAAPAMPATPAAPPPSADQIASAFNAPAVHALLEQCKSAYAPQLTSFTFSVSVHKSGHLHDVKARDPIAPQFVECATHALQSATIPRFDGKPVVVDQTLAL